MPYWYDSVDPSSIRVYCACMRKDDEHDDSVAIPLNEQARAAILMGNVLSALIMLEDKIKSGELLPEGVYPSETEDLVKFLEDARLGFFEESFGAIDMSVLN